MAHRIYGIVGEIKAGKGMVQERIQSSRDCDYTRFSMPLYDALKILDLPATRENLQDFSTLIRAGAGNTPERAVIAWVRACADEAYADRTARALAIFHLSLSSQVLEDPDEILRQWRRGFGEDILAKTIDRNCAMAQKDYVIADGLRRPADATILLQRPAYRQIYITAPFELRLQWAIAAAEKIGDAQLTPEKFLAQCQAETEVEIPIVGAMSHLRIDNVGTKEDVYRVLDAYLDSEDAVAYG